MKSVLQLRQLFPEHRTFRLKNRLLSVEQRLLRIQHDLKLCDICHLVLHHDRQLLEELDRLCTQRILDHFELRVDLEQLSCAVRVEMVDLARHVLRSSVCLRVGHHENSNVVGKLHQLGLEAFTLQDSLEQRNMSRHLLSLLGVSQIGLQQRFQILQRLGQIVFLDNVRHSGKVRIDPLRALWVFFPQNLV